MHSKPFVKMNHFEINIVHSSINSDNHSHGRLINGVYPYNASRIYYLHMVQLDVEIRSPESVLLLLLTFIAMALTLFLFCLLTNPVPEIKEPAPKKVSSQAGKKKERNRLKIDWSILKVSQVKLDVLSKIEMRKNPDGSEAPTIQADTTSSTSGKTDVTQNKKKSNLSEAVKAVRSGVKSKIKKRTTSADSSSHGSKQ